MSSPKNHSISQKRPIVICFTQENERQRFLKTHCAQTGFFVEKLQTDKGDFYQLYTGGYKFFAEAYEDRDKRKLGFFVKRKSETMRQSQTIRSLTKCLHVFGLEEDYIIHSGDRRAAWSLSGRGFQELELALKEKEADPQPAPTQKESAEEKEEKRARRKKVSEAAGDFYAVQDMILEAEKAFRRENRFTFCYQGVSTVSQAHDEGTVYSFQVAQPLSDNLQKKLKPNTVVDILQPEKKPIRASVVKYHARNNTLFMKLRVADLADIPVSSQIMERENVSYRHISNALGSIKRRTAENGFMEQLLFEGEIPPIDVKEVFADPSFNEKQREAINKAISTEDFLLIQGPPGTGKTKIIIEMVKHFVGQGQRVLICSQNNHAVDNVLKKCRTLHFPTAQKQPIHCLRIGTAENVETELQGNLLRPLTESIQHDMQKRSRSAFHTYREQRMAEAAKAEAFTEDCENILNLLKMYISIHTFALQLPQYFPRSGLEVIHTPAYLQNAREMAAHYLQLSTAAINLLVSLLNNSQTTNYLSALLSVQGELVRLHRQLNDVFSKKSFFRSLFLDYTHAEALRRLKDVMHQHDPVVRSWIQKLSGYRGNPVARLLPAVPAASISQNYSFDAKDYRRRISQVVETVKADCARLQRDLERWNDVLQHDNKSVGEALLKSIKIVGATCIGSSTRRIFSELEYDVAIVDEAGQISLHNLLVPLVKVKKFILVGDHIQLPPMDEKELRSYLETAVVPQVTDESDSEKNPFAPFRSVGEIYSKSLFEVLYSKSGEKYLSNHTVMLSEQYRCHPDIAAFVSGHFYANEYISGISPESRKLEIAGFCKPLCFVDTVRLPDRGEATKAGSTSPHNKAEARLCAEKVCDILMEIRRDPEKYSGLIDKAGNYDIGVISGYGDQVELLDSTLQTQLAQRLGGTPEAKDEAKRMVSRISIDTLDSFQGMEKEIIVFSCVRSNAECKVGFMNDTRRINVLMTRARSLLIMVGDSGTLCNTYATAKHNHAPVKDIFEDYIKTCRETGHYIAPGEEVGKV